MHSKLTIPMDKILDRRKVQASDQAYVQVQRLSQVYTALEDLKPKEGRDYRMTVLFEGDVEGIVIEGTTPIGQVFADHCRKNLAAALQAVKGNKNGRLQDNRIADSAGPASGGGGGRGSEGGNPVGDTEEHVL